MPKGRGPLIYRILALLVLGDGMVEDVSFAPGGGGDLPDGVGGGSLES